MPFNKIYAFSLALLILAAAAGCDTAGTPSGSTARDESAVLAVVDGTPITADEFKAEAAALSPNALEGLATGEARQKFLDKLIDKRLIVQEANRVGLAEDPEVVRQLEKLRDNLVLGLYINREILDKVHVTDEELKSYFDEHRADLGSVRLSHIVVATPAEAEEVLVKFKSGEPFKKLAREYSIDSSTKDKGGDLGFVRWAEFGTPSLKDVAFSLPPGEVSSIVQSRFGYHVMRVTDKKPAAESDYEDMKDALREDIEASRREKLFDEVLAGLKERSKITTDKDALDALSFLRPADLGQASSEDEGAPEAP